MKQLLDMHAHLAVLSDGSIGILTKEKAMALAIQELNVRRSQKIATFFSCGTQQEWEFMQQILAVFQSGDEIKASKQRDSESDRIFHRENSWFLSFGIHPWYSDRYCPKDWSSILKACDIIGEIGMDSVWCEIPLDVQRKVFEQQLQFAADLHKPVILHSKGQEKQIAEILRDFPEKKCVHWYSGGIRTFEQYLEMDCYFTMGPDLQRAGLYQHMLEKIPVDRLFIETDGLPAVAWATGVEAIPIEQVRAVLEGNLDLIARTKRIMPEELARKMSQNLTAFLGK